MTTLIDGANTSESHDCTTASHRKNLWFNDVDKQGWHDIYRRYISMIYIQYISDIFLEYHNGDVGNVCNSL